MGGDFLALCLAIEELAKIDSSVAITLEAAVVARRDAGLPVRLRRPARPVAARAVLGRAGWRRSASPNLAAAPMSPAACVPPPAWR